MIYKYLPDVRIVWSDVIIGAAITAGMFSVGKFLIGLYLGRTAVGSTYGTAGSFVVLLVWIYYSALICFFVERKSRKYSLDGTATGSVPSLMRCGPIPTGVDLFDSQFSSFR